MNDLNTNQKPVMDIQTCFGIILSANKQESTNAARRVRKIIYGSVTHPNENKHIKHLIKTAPEMYTRITEDWRQENFVMGISIMYFLKSEKLAPDALFPWLYLLLQHPNGVIRYASVRMIEHELGALTVHIRIRDYHNMFRDIDPEESDRILFSLFQELQNLAATTDEPKFHKLKFVDSLPVGVHKSVQLILARMHETCGDNYWQMLHSRLKEDDIAADRTALIEAVTEGDIIAQTKFLSAQAKLKQMRYELEHDMAPIMTIMFPNLNIGKIKTMVYEESLSPESDLVIILEQNLNSDIHRHEHREQLLNFLSSIWNLYPHKILNGYSPYELAAMSEITRNKTS